MAALKKYLFDLDFDAPVVVSAAAASPTASEDIVEPEAPPPPTFSEEDMRLKAEESFAAGRNAGIAEGAQVSERLLAVALTSLSQQFGDIETRAKAANEERYRDSVLVAVAVMKKLFPEWAKRQAIEEISRVVRECISHIDDDVRVTIRTAPDQLDAVREQATEIAQAAGFEGKMLYRAEAGFAPGECRVEWGDGGGERDHDRLWAEIDAIVAKTLGTMDSTTLSGAPASMMDAPPQSE